MMSLKKSNFNVAKTYFDCIDDEGNCFIIYWARLEFSIIKINYSGLIFSNAKGKIAEKSSLIKFNRPVIFDNLIMNNPHLQIKGYWKRIDPAVSSLLYQDCKGNELFWNCHHPKTQTSIEYKNKIYSGFGYAETLLLPIKPWQLPIDELRWGRFLSEKTTILWINWKDQHCLNKLYLNGTLFEDAMFEETKIVFGKGKYRLVFEQPMVIRKAKLSGVIAKMPWLKILFNSKILNTVELKYKSRSSFIVDSLTNEKGWSLYEIVTWHKRVKN